jgi:hypothetical protein
MTEPEPRTDATEQRLTRRGRRAARLGRIALALGIGTAGGALFWVLALPLPWMLGALCASTIAAMAKLPIA